jgi:hypothetical protein
MLISYRIVSRLTELGWGEEDLGNYESQRMREWKSLVCIAKPLTERSKSIPSW